MRLFEDIYRDKTVFITGHTGFKGSWLAHWLTSLGAKVIGYSRDLPTEPCHFKLLNTEMTSITGDILNYPELLAAIKEHQPSIVFHLAAQTIVKSSIEEPLETFKTNVLGTVNLFEAIREAQCVKACVNVTSDKCYLNREWTWGYRENDRLGGKDPYSASKSCAEIATAAWQYSYFPPEKFGTEHNTLIASVRAGNVIGGGDWGVSRIVTDIMRAYGSQTTLNIRKPKAIRPWQHVLDPLSGYLLVGLRLLKADKDCATAWNFGPTEKTMLSVGDLVARVKEFLPNLQVKLEGQPHDELEANILALDCSKAVNQLNWQPLWATAEAISHTANWYKAFYDKEVVSTTSDLEAYCNCAKTAKASWISV